MFIRTDFKDRKREDGSGLFVALFICLVVGLTLSGYLVLSSNRFQMTTRSSDWNAAIPVLEAGVEEALTHLTRDTNAPTANNWTASTLNGNQVYTKKRTFSDGSYYSVYIKDYNSSTPLIYSQGFVRSPFRKNQYIARTVRVGVTNPPTVFTRGIAVNGQVTLVGDPVVDGFDSRLGSYNTSSNRNALGGIATNGKTVGIVSIGGARVYGPVSTGAGGTVSVSSGGAIGDVAWVSGHTGVQSNWTDTTMNVAFPTNAAPTGTFSPLLVLPLLTPMVAGNYQINGNFSSSGDVVIGGNVTLYVTGTFDVKGNDTIKILPGGSLKLYVGGAVSMAGGGVLNGTGQASSFSIIGLSSCTSITYSGNADFVGTINAPKAAFTLKGTTDAYGAVIADSASMNGNTAFHYDAALAYQDGYVVSSWTELPN
jgi:hypothetical protein